MTMLPEAVLLLWPLACILVCLLGQEDAHD